MAPRYNIEKDLASLDGLQSTSPHWVLGFARYANPITYDPTKKSSISNDISFAYQERPVLIVDDLGDCISLSVSETKNSHTPQMSAIFADSGIKYRNEILPGDWVAACIVYSLDEAKRVAEAMATPKKINDWGSGLKFLGRVQTIRKRVVVSDSGVPQSIYSLIAVAFSEFDSTVMYYPHLQYTDSIPASMDKFGEEVSNMVRGNESNERGAIDINTIVPKLIQVIFGRGAWSGQTFREDPLTPNLAYIVPQTVLKWLGVENNQGTFADIMKVLVGIQKYSDTAEATNDTAAPGTLFWPDGATLSQENSAFYCPFRLVGSFPSEVVPQTTTTPWNFISNYINQPLNEPLVSLRSDADGNIFPFFTIRQTPYTSEVGQAFDLETFQANIEPSFEAGLGYDLNNPPPVGLDLTTGQPFTADKSFTSDPTASPRASTFVRVPTTRFLELPRWVVAPSLTKESDIGRSDLQRQNLVFVFGVGSGVAFNEYDQAVNAGPVKDDLDILRNGIRPYMPSVNCFLRDIALISTDWRDIMADVVMGQHLALNGNITISGVRAPIVSGDNVEFEGVIYHIENVVHSCSISADGKRNFLTRLALSRGMVDKNATKGTAEERAAAFPNTASSDTEGWFVGNTRD